MCLYIICAKKEGIYSCVLSIAIELYIALCPQWNLLWRSSWNPIISHYGVYTRVRLRQTGERVKDTGNSWRSLRCVHTRESWSKKQWMGGVKRATDKEANTCWIKHSDFPSIPPSHSARPQWVCDTIRSIRPHQFNRAFIHFLLLSLCVWVWDFRVGCCFCSATPTCFSHWSSCWWSIYIFLCQNW